MISPESLTQASQLLQKAQRPLLVTHVAPDGDAAGSLLGMGWILRALGRSPRMVCQDPLPRHLAFLPGFNDVTQETGPEPYDLVIALDCSDRPRMGRVDVNELVPVLNIDHHVTNSYFGNVNLVDEKAVSTTQVLYDLVLRLGLPLDERVATCLLTGIVTDTRGFRTANVTSQTLRIAVELTEAGAPLATITQNGLDRRPLAILRLWGAGLGRLEWADGIVWTSLPLDVQQAVGHDGYGDAGLANLLVSAEEACVAVVFTEQPDGHIEVGFRSTPGYDVSRVALALGGGGHPMASGCRLEGPLEEVQQRVLALLREELDRQRRRPAQDDGRHTEPE